MKLLIVNGDDFGASPGTNRGIVDAHRNGILTSTSLMIDMPGAREAIELSREFPDLSVGLHFCLTLEGGEPICPFEDSDACRDDLERQYSRFQDLLGRAPTHLDSHRNIHRDPRLTALFQDVARRSGLPLREHGRARYYSNFYGQWDGETHPEQIGVDNLIAILRDEVGEGITELACHPGYEDERLGSSYSKERRLELETLCDARVRRAIESLRIRRIGFADLGDYPEARCEEGG